MNVVIFEFFNSLAGRNSFLDGLVEFFAVYLGIALLLFAIFFLLFHRHSEWLTEESEQVFKKRTKEILIILISVFGAWLVAYFTKNVLEMPRPFLVLPDVNLLFPHGGFDSFPSGHATAFAALATALYFVHRRLGKWYFAGAVLIGLARVAAGIHFPLDILGGLVLGILVSLVVFRLSKFSPST